MVDRGGKPRVEYLAFSGLILYVTAGAHLVAEYLGSPAGGGEEDEWEALLLHKPVYHHPYQRGLAGAGVAGEDQHPG